VRGCYCSSECGYDVIFGDYDWCYTKDKCGRYSLTRLAYYDYCSFPENKTYEGQTAQAKQAALWSAVSKNTTSGTYPNVLGIFLESVKTTFEDTSDVFPATRLKYVHSVGFVGEVTFTPVSSPYTGIFGTGSRNALVRFSSATDLAKDPPLIVPGFAIKFLRSKIHSANFMSMPSLDGQSDFNFFAYNFSNHPANPTGWAVKILGEKFSEASNCPLIVGLSDTARYNEDGSMVANPVFPFEIVWVPTGKVVFPSTYYDLKQLGVNFNGIPIGTDLFKVYAYASPSARSKAPTLIGTLTSTSRFIPSSFGDSKLFFKHIYAEDDFKLRPEWLDQIDSSKDCAGLHPGPTPPNPPPTSLAVK